MEIIKNFLKGILIGAGGILPGISSGVLCVIFGIYEKLIDSILYFFKDIYNNLRFLCPIVFGGGIGVIFVSKILEKLLNSFQLQTKGVFIGLIIGGIPLIISQVNKAERVKLKNIVCLIIALLIGIFTVYLEKNISNYTYQTDKYGYLILSGVLMSIGVIVPGVSSTVILMLLGIYTTYLSAISTLNLSILIPIGIGLIIGSLIFMKLIKILLEKFYAQTMFSIIGFTIGSIFVLIPEIKNIIESAIFISCTILGYTIISNIKSM